MSYWEIFSLVGFGASIIGISITVATFINGRLTRREIIKVIKETQNLIREEGHQTRKLITTLHRDLVEILNRIEERLIKSEERLTKMEEILIKSEERLAKLEEILERVVGITEKVYEKVS